MSPTACPRCGTMLAASGVCPRCVLSLGLGEESLPNEPVVGRSLGSIALVGVAVLVAQFGSKF